MLDKTIYLKSIQGLPIPLPLMFSNDRTMLRSLMITAADLCSTAKPWNVCRQSVKKICEEFYAQVC